MLTSSFSKRKRKNKQKIFNWLTVYIEILVKTENIFANFQYIWRSRWKWKNYEQRIIANFIKFKKIKIEIFSISNISKSFILNRLYSFPQKKNSHLEAKTILKRKKRKSKLEKMFRWNDMYIYNIRIVGETNSKQTLKRRRAQDGSFES